MSHLDLPSVLLCVRQQGPAVALCAVHIAVRPELYVASSDMFSNATFHYCSKGQPEVARKITLRVKGTLDVVVETRAFGLR